jgi:hypothetical protein
LQARLILEVYDTIALQAELKVQGAGSYSGCPFCDLGRGMYRLDSLPKIHFPGHRVMLEDDHFLRSFGQSGNCCPAKYYDNLSDEAMPGMTQESRREIFQSIISPENATPGRASLFKKKFEPCDRDEREINTLRSTLTHVEKTNKYVFHHSYYSDMNVFA